MKKIFALCLLLPFLLSACGDKAIEPSAEDYRGAGVIGKVEKIGFVPNFREVEERLKKDPASIVTPDSLAMVGGASEFRKSFPKGTTFKVKDDTWAFLNKRGGSGSVVITVKTPKKEGYTVEAVFLEDTTEHWWLVQTANVN